MGKKRFGLAKNPIRKTILSWVSVIVEVGKTQSKVT